MISLENQYLLSVDVGTQSVRVALFDAGIRLVELHSEPQHITASPKDNRAEADALAIWESVKNGIQSLLRSTGIAPSQIKGIGTGAIMHSPVPLGPGGELLLKDVQIYSDKRAKQLVDAFSKSPDAAEAYTLTGSIAIASWMGFKIRWMRENQPDIYERTWKFVSMNGFINYRLCGVAAMDYAEASGSYLMAWRSRQWSPKLARMVGVDLAKMPDIHNAFDIVGRVTEQAAKETGLAPGTPVVAGSSDMSSAAMAGCLKYNDGVITTGTASGADLFLAEPLLDRHIINLRHVVDGWLAFGSVDCSGGSMTWFKDTFFAQEEAGLQGGSVLSLIDKMAGKVAPGADGLLFLPQLLGERENLGQANAKGVFMGISLTSTKAHFARALMEGICYAEYRVMRIMLEKGVKVNRMFCRGGGANSKVWNQIRADIYQMPIMILAEANNTGLIGSALLAAKGAGLIDDLVSEAEKQMIVRETYTPNPALAPKYRVMQQAYETAHDALCPSFDILEQASKID